MAGNTNFDALLTTTLNNHRSTMEDNVFTATPLVMWLKRKDKIRTVRGGAKIVVPLMYGQNSTAGSYSGYDTIATTAQDGISAAEYPWRQYAATVAINGLEEAENDGDEEIIDLLEAKIEQTEGTIIEKMDQMFFADGTGNASKDFLGIKALVGDHSDGVTTVGNINSATAGNEFWRSHRQRTVGSLQLSHLRVAYNTTSKGRDTVDLQLTTQTLFEAYESLLQPQERFTDTKTADGGFQNLLFKGSVVMFDEYCDSGFWYALNSKYLKLAAHKKVWFKSTPFVKPSNQDARFSQILSYGNLTVSNRKRQGLITGATA